jgi:hypothetical protein
VAIDCPLRYPIRANGVRPAEADHAGAHRDPESAGIRFLAERSAPCAHGCVRSKSAVAEATRFVRGNRSPRASAAKQLRINASLDGVADTFGTYNKPTSGGLARACALPSSDRPLQLSRPAALTALGARGLPPSPAAAKSRASPHRECCDAAGCQLVQRVEPGTDDAMAGIEIPAPQNPDAAHLRINSSEESPLSGVQAPCPVYVRSPDQLNTSAQFNAPHMMHRST